MYFSRGEVRVLDMVVRVFNPRTQEAGGGQISHFPAILVYIVRPWREGGGRQTGSRQLNEYWVQIPRTHRNLDTIISQIYNPQIYRDRDRIPRNQLIRQPSIGWGEQKRLPNKAESKNRHPRLFSDHCIHTAWHKCACAQTECKERNSWRSEWLTPWPPKSHVRTQWSGL